VGVLAEQIIQFRAVGLGTVEGAIARVGGALRGMGSVAGGVFGRIGSAIGSILNPMNLLQGMGIGIGMSIASGLGSAIKSAVQLAADTEALSTSFRVLLGSADAAKQMIADINKFAAETPFEQMELGEAAKGLLGARVAAEQIIPTMRKLGDIAAITQTPLNEIVAIYSKIRTQGKLTGETFEQLATRAPMLIGALAQAAGVSESQLRDAISQGKVGFEQVEAAIKAVTSQGGAYADGMKQLSQTTGGLWSTVTGNLKTALAELGTQIIETFNIRDILASAGTWLDGLSGKIKGLFSQWGPVLREFAKSMAAFFKAIWEMVSEVITAISNVFDTWLGLSDFDLAGMLEKYYIELQFFFENWRLMLAYTIEYWKLVLTNLWERIKNLFSNAVAVVVWFGENWRDIFVTSVNFIVTVFWNTAKNLKAIWQAVLDFIAGKGFHVDWTPLTQGFQSTIKKMPEFTEAAIKETTPELDRLAGELAEKRKEFDERRAKEKEKGKEEKSSAPPPAPPAGGPAPPSAPTGALAATAAGGPKVSFTGFAELARSMQQRAVEEFQKRQAEAATKTADGVAKLASAVEGDALKVKLTDPVQAVYG